MFKSAFNYAVPVLEHVTLGARDLAVCGRHLPYELRGAETGICAADGPLLKYQGRTLVKRWAINLSRDARQLPSYSKAATRGRVRCDRPLLTLT